MYQVLTNQGFKNFESFLNQGMSRELLKISFSDNTILKCTAEHQLLLDDEYIEAQFLIIGDIISGKEICNIESIDNEIVYDLLNVEDTHAYYTNGVMSHNCSFVYIDECLGKNTLIRIKNKNGFEFDISIGSFYNLLSEENNTNDYIINTKNYSVLTKTGFQKIDGIKKSFSSDNLDIYFDDETIFTCTSYHFIEKDFVFLPACLLNVSDIINNKKIIQIRQNKKTIEVYDLVNVANGNSYYTDGINSHNCAFLDNWTDFYASVFPTLTSGEKTKMLFTSCVTKDTYVYTDKGIQQVSEFVDDTKKGLYEISSYSVYGHNKLRNGNLFYNSGYVDTRIIKTRSGEVECSLNHKWLCYCNGVLDWKETKDLIIGDYLIEQVGQECYGNDIDISDFTPDKKYVKKNIIFPKNITEDIAYFLGLFIAEGCATYKKGSCSTTITCGDDISFAFENIGLYFSKYDIHYSSGSKEFVQFLIYYGIDITKKALYKEVPPRILKSPKNIQQAWLRGYFDGDGSISSDCVKVTSVSKKLISAVKIMLMNMGIKCSYFISTSRKYDVDIPINNDTYNLEIYGDSAKKYIKEIGSSIQRKKERFINYDSVIRNGSPKDIIPFSKTLFRNENVTGIWNGITKNGEHFSRKFLLSIKKYIIDNNYFDSDKIKFLYDNIINDNLQFVPVKKITESKNNVYDFSLADNKNDIYCHSVTYNNVIGHQTPCGMNHFYEFWEGATKGLPDASGNLVKNGFYPIFAPWYRIPGRGEKFKETILKGINYDYDRFRQEYECISGDSVVTIQLENGDILDITLEELEKLCI